MNTCHIPIIALAIRISRITNGSTNAVMVSSPSSKSAKTFKKILQTFNYISMLITPVCLYLKYMGLLLFNTWHRYNRFYTLLIILYFTLYPDPTPNHIYCISCNSGPYWLPQVLQNAKMPTIAREIFIFVSYFAYWEWFFNLPLAYALHEFLIPGPLSIQLVFLANHAYEYLS